MVRKVATMVTVVLILAAIAAGAGVTYITKWVDTHGGETYLYEKDKVRAGEETIILYNENGNTKFGKAIIADCGGMAKSEYVDMRPTGRRDPYKYEEVKWHNADVVINKKTKTPDIEQHQYLSSSGSGRDVMEVYTDGRLKEYGYVVITPKCKEPLPVLPAPKHAPAPPPPPPQPEDP